MTPEEITKAIHAEIGSDWNRSNAHGVNLRKCLIDPPQRKKLLDSCDSDKPIELWLVLEEDPAQHSGYEIVFDDVKRMYGLATAGSFIGFYGTFLETLEAM